MNRDKLSAIILLVASIILGYFSFFLARFIKNSFWVLLLSLPPIFVVLFLNARFIKKKKYKLKIDGDFWMLILMWFVSWAIFLNLAL
ncbi:MAG: hypothetical protein DRP08_00930 [Candidatus Aenigmatarchaeota archaeon]|nr:hypothetical protein [Candidatus Aenigmarchaeota archaeon]RLJ04758.1 MAG: hypothetical protein DRP08_00930 [Candidatus Aenigmarchaeota archaeon]